MWKLCKCMSEGKVFFEWWTIEKREWNGSSGKQWTRELFCNKLTELSERALILLRNFPTLKPYIHQITARQVFFKRKIIWPQEHSCVSKLCWKLYSPATEWSPKCTLVKVPSYCIHSFIQNEENKGYSCAVISNELDLNKYTVHISW